MSSLMDNEIFQGLAICITSGIVLLIIHRLLAPILFKLDEHKIFKFIKNSKKTFRTTESICANTRIAPQRIKIIGSRSKKLRRNVGPKESWRLKE